MKIRINELKFNLDEPFTDDNIRNKIAKKTKLRKDQITSYKIIRESLDARKGISFSYVMDIETPKTSLLLQNGFSVAPDAFVSIDEVDKLKLKNIVTQVKHRPVIIGFGPAGLFAALQLARAGLRPIVLEMGEDVDNRQKTVEEFWETGKLNLNSNVQFGEGGAGAFSDGKLTTRIKDRRIEFVLEYLVKAGAPSEIIYKNKPHIGTDILCDVVKNLRNEIIALGGEIFFNTKVTNLESAHKNDQKDNLKQIQTVICESGQKFFANHIVLAIGHSSRDLFYKLKSLGVAMEQKPFAMGVRIEHPQKMINGAQYGMSYNNEKLGAAEYKLTFSASNGRSVYSFCMCPGGRVVGSASEENRLVINGMSYHSRALKNANSAILVNVDPIDFGGSDVLAGVELQRKLESMAFEAGGGNYTAPVEMLSTFLGDDFKDYNTQYSVRQNQSKLYYDQLGINYENEMSDYATTYTPNIHYTSLNSFLPEFMSRALREAIVHFGKQIPGFDDPRIVITAIESRSSSPVRIMRDFNTLESISHPGLYPCGEGAGYAGGITSSAVDGVKVAEEIIKDLIKKTD